MPPYRYTYCVTLSIYRAVQSTHIALYILPRHNICWVLDCTKLSSLRQGVAQLVCLPVVQFAFASTTQLLAGQARLQQLFCFQLAMHGVEAGGGAGAVVVQPYSEVSRVQQYTNVVNRS